MAFNIVVCIFGSLKKQLFSRKQRREGHYTADGSTHDKLQNEYAHLFLHSASPIAEDLAKSSSMEPMKAKCLMSHIFEVFLHIIIPKNQAAHNHKHNILMINYWNDIPEFECYEVYILLR